MTGYRTCHGKTCFITHADSDGPDQPARMCRLIRTFAVHKSMYRKKKVHIRLSGFADRSGSLLFACTPKTAFSHDVVHINIVLSENATSEGPDWAGFAYPSIMVAVRLETDLVL